MDGYIRVKAGKEFWDILNLIFTDEFMQKHTNFESTEFQTWDEMVMKAADERFAKEKQ